MFVVKTGAHWMTGSAAILSDAAESVRALTAAAAGINGRLGAYLVWIGRRQKSLILEANLTSS
jgi:hypothetical protein